MVQDLRNTPSDWKISDAGGESPRNLQSPKLYNNY